MKHLTLAQLKTNVEQRTKKLDNHYDKWSEIPDSDKPQYFNSMSFIGARDGLITAQSKYIAALETRLAALEQPKHTNIRRMPDGRLVVEKDWAHQPVSHSYTVKGESSTDETTDFELIAPDVFPPSSPAECKKIKMPIVLEDGTKTGYTLDMEKVCTCETFGGAVDEWTCPVCGGGRF